MPFGLPDAAMLSQMAKQEQVPQDQLMQWAANKGIPMALVQLMLKYDALQAASQRQGQAQQPPSTTVSQDLDQGLAAIRQPPQQQMMQPPANPGIAGLNTGAMENAQYASGGIVAFANRGAVEGSAPSMDFSWMNNSGRKYSNELPLTFDTGLPQQYVQPIGTGAGPDINQPLPTVDMRDQEETNGTPPSQEEARVAPSSSGVGDYGMGELTKKYKQIDKNFEQQLADLNQYEVYQASTDPAIQQERERAMNEKLASALKLPKDQWNILVADGLAMWEEASKPRQPGEANAWTYWGAGAKAAAAKAKEIQTQYDAAQKELDKHLIDLNHQEWVASETNKKDAIAFRNALRDKTAQLQKDRDSLQFDFLKTIGTLGAQRDATMATREATAASQQANLEAKLAGIASDDARNIVAAVQNEVKRLSGAVKSDGTPYTEEEIQTVIPQIQDNIIAMYKRATRSVAPSGGVGAGLKVQSVTPGPTR